MVNRSLKRIIICILTLAFMWTVGAQAARRYYVAVDSEGTGDGTSWAKPTTLLNALNSAVEGDTIWMRGYVKINKDSVYVVPSALQSSGYNVPAGVMVYGGFNGTETSESQRELIDGKANRFKYVTDITGDITLTDEIDATASSLIYPDENTSRSDNAYHTLTLTLSGAANNSTTILNGLTIAGGSANYTSTDDGQHGGGVLIKGSGSAFRIEKCMFINNYAILGGAVYVDATVTSSTESVINGCIVFNNVAGKRNTDSNSGGGIYIAGNCTVVNTAIYNNERGGVYLKGMGGKVINCTVGNNSSAAVDYEGASQNYGKEETSDASNVINTVLWGNTTLAYDSIGGKRPVLDHCAYYFPTTIEKDRGCVNISKDNREGTSDVAPCFTSPSPTAGFDLSFDWLSQNYPLWTWDLEYESALKDKGDNSAYKTAYGDKDIMGDARNSGTSIDIGAYEYVQVTGSHRRYVKPGGSDGNDGTSWDKAMANPQTAIDDLYDKYPGEKCEVWIAKGTYTPQSYWEVGQSTLTFLMRDGISVYGGFDGTETALSDRKKGTMPWSFTNPTILQAVNFSATTAAWAENRWQWNSESTHVVWFAPKPVSKTVPITSFTHTTWLDGVTIEGGNASGSDDLYSSDCGGGVYMAGTNTRLTNSIVRHCSASSNGGGVYSLGGRVEGCLIHSNGADEDGGGVYVDEIGMVLRSFLVNNAAKDGAGVYLNKPETDGSRIDAQLLQPNYLILSTSVVAHNTQRENAAVYANRGGIVEQSTIVNNATVRATDEVDAEASRTGGLFINKYCKAINTFIGGNSVGGSVSSTDTTTLETAQMYVNSPNSTDVRFYNCAITAVNYSPWNDVYQSETIELPNYTVSSYFTGGDNIWDKYGVQETWGTAEDADFDTFHWQVKTGSAIVHRGMHVNLFPTEVILKPDLDIASNLFEKTPTIGANIGNLNEIVPTRSGKSLNIYVEAEPSSYSGDGHSWESVYPSLTAVLDEVSGWNVGSVVGNGTVTVATGDTIKIHLPEGDLHPRFNYANSDPKSASIIVNKCNLPLVLIGGYSADDKSVRNPSKYRSDFNGNNTTGTYDGGVYHVVTVQPGATSVTFDGFSFTDGSAVGSALRQQGAGLYVYAGADVTLRNCIFENNCAGKNGSAVYAAPSNTNANTTVTMINCVVNNNSDRDEGTDDYVINVKGDLTVNHVTVVNNHGKAPLQVSSTNNSFAAGNCSYTTKALYSEGSGNTVTLATTGADGAKNFSNPTNSVGFSYSGNVYYGGNSEFQPLTSVTDASAIINASIINKGEYSSVSTDIVGNPRNLGGTPDLGAYEAELPDSGRVIYVRDYGNTTDKGGDGSSWDKAINGNCTSYTSDHNFSGYDVEPYANGTSLTGLQWAVDEAYYRSLKKSNGSIAYNSLSYTDGNTGYSSSVDTATVVNDSRVKVYVAEGEYLRSDGYIMRNGVDVYGGFPPTGNPGTDERSPKKYLTIIETNKDLTNFTWGSGSSSNYTLNHNYSSAYSTKRVLTQPFPYYRGSNSTEMEKTYNEALNPFVETTWDGFTIRNGRTQIYHNCDGGAGVALRENGVLENCVIENNVNKGFDYIRGGGIFCNKGIIKNCVIQNNQTWGVYSQYWGANYGGGMYMRDGTCYNTCISGNKMLNSDDGSEEYLENYYISGAAVYFENGLFYNNTIVNNSSFAPVATGGYFSLGSLKIYNTIFYGNNPKGSSPVIRLTADKNNKVETTIAYCLFDKSQTSSSYSTATDAIYKVNNAVSVTLSNNQFGVTEENIFGDYPNSLDLCKTSKAVNAGLDLETIDITLPSVDAGYTNRIKDCAIDIGAYEYDNSDNISYETSEDGDTLAFYVCQNGWGNRSGSSAANAACASKLQSVLTKAGELKASSTGKDKNVVVKVAGYGYEKYIKKYTKIKTETTTQETYWYGQYYYNNGYYNFYQYGSGNKSTKTDSTETWEKVENAIEKTTETTGPTTSKDIEDPSSTYSWQNTSSSQYITQTITTTTVTTETWTEEVEETNDFVYHANTLAKESDPQSYTYLIPNGVELRGGYYEGTGSNGVYTAGSGWKENDRNVMERKTILSAVTKAETGSDVPDGINGYHVVTFGSWPESNTDFATEITLDSVTVIDGVWLTNGAATEKSGWRGVGGGAVVPMNAHVRNCVVENCEATDGAGLYLLPGAAVSGTLIRNNTASGEGGGIYGVAGAEGTNGDTNLSSFVVSCTIANNEAKTGGGVRHEKKSLVMNNDIIWGNTAVSDKQISAAYSNEFSETLTTGGEQYDNSTTVYPYSDCFVMAYDGLKSTTRNTTMTSDSATYFLDGTDLIPRTYSPLLNMGVENRYQLNLWESRLRATSYDMRGVERIESAYRSLLYERITPGAFAVNAAQADTADYIFTRLFVSQGGGAYFNRYSIDGGSTWRDADAIYSENKTAKQWCVGRSFYTPFNSLGAALDYIREVRETYSKNTDGTYTPKPGVLDATTHFEIFIAEGEYKPTRRRKHSHTASGEENNEQNNSFSIPENVAIYGGFSSTDTYADFESIPKDKIGTDKTYSESDVSAILGLGTGTTVTLGVESNGTTTEVCTLNRKSHAKANGEYTDLAGILYKRNLKSQMSDMNTNSLLEPWGFKNQTILSGNINGVENVHHVVYSEAAYHSSTGDGYYNDKYGVTLDGITINGGITSATLKAGDDTTDKTEVGHGGALFSDNVNYTLNRCRIVGNEGVHGGGVCVKGATLNVISSVFGANKAKAATTGTGTAFGGALKVEYANSRGAFNAVNSLFTNNEADGTGSLGGAIYLDANCKANIMNCIIARNKADNDGAVYAPSASDVITNTVLWGNEGTEQSSEATVTYCASDVTGTLVPTPDANNYNIKLSTTNMDLTGPRFKEPSTVAGVSGNKTSAKWNPVGITVLTDAGTGEITYVDGKCKTTGKDVNGNDMEKATGAYHNWWADDAKLLPDYLKVKQDTLNAEYILSDVAKNRNIYYRYNGPKDSKNPTDEKNQQMSKVIDIGVYEFQYLFDFSEYNAVYVDTEDHGTGDGTSWVNATSDLRSAIMALANPTGTTKDKQFERRVYVRDGEYFSPLLAGGNAYSIYAAGNNTFLDSLAIMGACTGRKIVVGNDSIEEQDFSKQTILYPNPSKESQTKTLLSVNIQDMGGKDSNNQDYHDNQVPITISGFTFRNDGTNADNAVGVTKVGTKSKLTFKNCAFRDNKADGLEMTSNTGEVLLYNVLFADGGGTGLIPDGKTTVVNATFANNATDMSKAPFQTGDNYYVYNTVSWNKSGGTRNLVTDETYNKNENLGNAVNTDIQTGPMFVDPDKGDYNIEPSHKLLNAGGNKSYSSNVGTEPAHDVDLANATRLVGDQIDIGAYEYQGVLQPIIYVRSGLATTGDGTSWDKALSSLQEAANLAGLYYDKMKTTGYVFANRNVDASSLNIVMPGAKLYGGMDLQTSDKSATDETDEVVAELLGKRSGVIESTQMSTISNLTFNANSVIDGFKVKGDVTLKKGNLFTSVVDGNVTGGGEGSASLLYNTLVLGNVANVDTVVNVTATGTVGGTVVDDNIASATTNGYVSADYWNYQLKETSEYIDKGNGTYTDIMIKRAGHSVDIAGNKRIRNTVDNGCFETWYLYEGTDNEANATDYPHGKSVVYVMNEGTELKLSSDFYTEDNAFNPGFLLLDHHAGLRGLGSTIALTNFALDRKVEAGEKSLVNMPFDVTSTVNTSSVPIRRYNGNTRAANAYKYSSTNSTAWEDGSTSMTKTTEGSYHGRLLDNSDGTATATVRFYGSSYEENSEAKSVVLTQYNHIESWPADNSKKFTHKENMGWNIFGSPYLCAMNFSDMEYGRVMYHGNEFDALSTVLSTASSDSFNKTLEGYVPMGDGLFTQTATLKTTETFVVAHSEATSGDKYTVTPEENVVVVLKNATTRGVDDTEVYDAMRLNAVAAKQSRSDFDISADGVKWMATDSVPQLYAERDGGRYSLLSAVSIDGVVPVGVTLPESGQFAFSLAGDFDPEKYECIILKDAQTHAAVDLLESDYEFATIDAGDISGRFTIVFNQKLTDKTTAIQVFSPQRSHIAVYGLQAGDIVTAYSANGSEAARVETQSTDCEFTAHITDVAIVEIVRDGKTVAVKKVRMK